MVLFESMASVPSLLVRGELTDLLSPDVYRMQKMHPSMEVPACQMSVTRQCSMSQVC